MTQLARHRQLGFTLLECMVAAALATALALALTRAVLDSLRAIDRINDKINLTDHALNILSDLREMTAYDPEALRRITGRSVTSTIIADGGQGALAVTVTISGVSRTGSDPIVASVTVSDAAGTSVTESQGLFVEAPAPGSVIDQVSPAPSQGG